MEFEFNFQDSKENPRERGFSFFFTELNHVFKEIRLTDCTSSGYDSREISCSKMKKIYRDAFFSLSEFSRKELKVPFFIPEVSTPTLRIRRIQLFSLSLTNILGKPLETPVIVGPIPRHLERADAAARFRLTTEHDFLGVYLHWLDLVDEVACPLYGHARMDGDHLLQCTELDEYPTGNIVSRYWEARRQMVVKPITGVG
ncbi:reverse transcriptase [Trichonephila clavipes]|nr:reverse transcriptase [Trichonephila clavipes]